MTEQKCLEDFFFSVFLFFSNGSVEMNTKRASGLNTCEQILCGLWLRALLMNEKKVLLATGMTAAVVE